MEKESSVEKVENIIEKTHNRYGIYIFIIIIIVAIFIGMNRSGKEANSITCKNEEITPEMVEKLGGNFDKKMVKELNDETPYCKDLCLQQLDYSQKYDDWSAEEDLRKSCADLGIFLPNN